MPPLGSGLLSLQLGPGVDGFVGPVLQVTDQRPDVVERMKNITAAGNLRQSLLVPGESPKAKSAMVASGAKPRSTSSSSRMPQVSASRCSSGLSKKQKVDLASTPTKTGSRLEDLIEEADEDGGEVVLLVDSPGMSNGAVHDVVHGPQGDPIIEEVTQQFDDAAVGTMADQHQGQDQLPQPSLGDR